MRGPTTAPALATARTDVAFRQVVRTAAVAMVAVGFALSLALARIVGATRPGSAHLLLFVGLVVAVGSFGRGDLREVRVTAAGLDLVGYDGVVRSIPGQSIGALGTSGPRLAGRLFAIPIGWAPMGKGRIVVLDHRGRVICARRAGWMKVADVARLAATAGVPGGASPVRSTPGTSLPPPPGMDRPMPGPARTDPATVAAAAAIARHLRHLGLLVFAVLGVGIGSFVAMSRLPAGHDLRGYLGWSGSLGVLGFAFGGPMAALHGAYGSTAKRVLRLDQPWWPVEAVVVSGLVTDPTVRVVGVIDPRTGEAQWWWSVEHGGARGWLQGDDRTAFWFLPSADGKKALIAPPDRSHIAVLEHRVLSEAAQAEARTAVQDEAADWQARQTWAAWADVQHAQR